MLLDLRLPDIDGLDVCRRLRERSDVPIIVVTARGEEVDRVVGLELGADDYVVKPFGLRELIARIRAVTRRTRERGHAARAAAASATSRSTSGPAAPRSTAASSTLTPKEFDLLAALARDPGAAVSRRRLLEEVWETTWYGSAKTIDVHVAALRAQARRPGLDRDGARHRLPPPRGVTRRLLLGYLGVTLFVLARARDPARRPEPAHRAARPRGEGRARRDVFSPRTPRTPCRPATRAQLGALRAIAYSVREAAPAARVVIVDKRGIALVDTSARVPRRRELRLPAGDRRGAAAATSPPARGTRRRCTATCSTSPCRRLRRRRARRRADHVPDSRRSTRASSATG